MGALITYLNKNFRLDDALIYYRYIENFINGNGLVYNIGERFNAISSPLYIYISILVSSVTREVEITQWVLNGIFIISAGIALAYLFYSLNKPTLAFLSSLIFISTKFFYTTFGLETNLFILISMLCIIFYYKKNYLLLSVLSGLLILTRGEGLFLVLILWSLIYYENRKNVKINYIIIVAVIVLSSHLFNYYYYSSFFQHTLTAKISQGKSGYWGVGYSFILNYNFLFRMAFNNQPFYVLYVMILFLTGFANHIKDKLSLILFTYSIFITIFHISLNIQNYHWYYSIHFLNLVVFVSYGILDIKDFIGSKFNKPLIRNIILGFIFIYPVLTQVELFQLLHREGPIDGYKAAGEWLRESTPDNIKVACVEIGHIGWYSKRYTVDMLGLVNPALADYVGTRQTDKWYEIYKPEYILVHDPIAGTEVFAQKFIENGTYAIEPSFIFKGYKIYKKSGKN